MAKGISEVCHVAPTTPKTLGNENYTQKKHGMYNSIAAMLPSTAIQRRRRLVSGGALRHGGHRRVASAVQKLTVPRPHA